MMVSIVPRASSCPAVLGLRQLGPSFTALLFQADRCPGDHAVPKDLGVKYI